MRIDTLAGCHPGNFITGRPGGLRPELIVLHSIGGTVADATRRFHTAGASMSAHYAIGADGSVTQFVAETDTAFHAGLVINPTARVVMERPATNPNFYSIGIEHEGRSDVPWSDRQKQASADVVAGIAARWKIPLDADHVVTHQAIRASVRCPGPACDVPALLAMAAARVTEAPLPSPLSLRVITRANIRTGPMTASPIVRTVMPDTSFVAVEATHGERVSSTDLWYIDEANRYIWAGATDRPQLDADDAAAFPSTDLMEITPAPSPAPAPSAVPPINRTQALDPARDFNPVATAKNLIVLHFTAGGSARSALDTWRGDERRVATAYVVDLDGTIYEAFDPRFWAHHLGIKGVSAHDKRSIGIEIVNAGPLKLAAGGTTLNWWPKDFGTAFCTLNDSDRYVTASYRGVDHFAAYKPVQTEAVARLIHHLAERFSIPKTLADAGRRHQFDPTHFQGFRGIATHANFRADKWDVGPAFDWASLGI